MSKLGTIHSIVYTPEETIPKPADHYVRVATESAQLLTAFGIEGDKKGGHPKRQLNIMCHEMMSQLANEGYKAEPGEMGEQIVVTGIAIDDLPAGTRLQFGEQAIVEIIEPRRGCEKFERIQGRPKEATRGRLGAIATVLQGGEIRIGDAVKVSMAQEI